MLAAGAPLSRGGDDERMLRAVREIVDADPGIGLRAGVTRGYVFGCDLGSDRRRVYTVMGDAVNLSARLMSKAAPGEIIVSRPVMEWASSRFEYDALEPFLVKGKTRADLRRPPRPAPRPAHRPRPGRHRAVRPDGRADDPARVWPTRRAAGRGSVVVDHGRAGHRQEPARRRGRAPAPRLRRACSPAASRSTGCRPTRSPMPDPAPAARHRRSKRPRPRPARRSSAWLAEHLPAVLPLAPLLAVSIEADVDADARGRCRAPGVPPGAHAAAAVRRDRPRRRRADGDPHRRRQPRRRRHPRADRGAGDVGGRRAAARRHDIGDRGDAGGRADRARPARRDRRRRHDRRAPRQPGDRPEHGPLDRAARRRQPAVRRRAAAVPSPRIPTPRSRRRSRRSSRRASTRSSPPTASCCATPPCSGRRSTSRCSGG